MLKTIVVGSVVASAGVGIYYGSNFRYTGEYRVYANTTKPRSAACPTEFAAVQDLSESLLNDDSIGMQEDRRRAIVVLEECLREHKK